MALLCDDNSDHLRLSHSATALAELHPAAVPAWGNDATAPSPRRSDPLGGTNGLNVSAAWTRARARAHGIHGFVDVTAMQAAKGYRVIVRYLRRLGPTRSLSANTP